MRLQYLAAAGLLAVASMAAAQKPASIDVPSRLTLKVGQDTTVNAVVKDESGQPVSGATVSFTSADTSIAKVTMMGSIQGVSPGSTQITATVGGAGAAPGSVTATIDVEVRQGMEVPATFERSAPDGGRMSVHSTAGPAAPTRHSRDVSAYPLRRE